MIMSFTKSVLLQRFYLLKETMFYINDNLLRLVILPIVLVTTIFFYYVYDLLAESNDISCLRGTFNLTPYQKSIY